MNVSTSIDQIIKRSLLYFKPKRILLFGSHARGTATSQSDIDLAFEVPQVSHADWSRFVVSLDEDPVTLKPFDVLRLDEVGEEIKDRISREGKCVYESE